MEVVINDHNRIEPPLEFFVRGAAPAEPAVQIGLLQKAMSWAKAEVSLVFQGPVSDSVYEARLLACSKCEFRKPTSNGVGLGFCTKCGCGDSPRAELTVKGRMPKATCPLERWPKADAPDAPLPDTLE